MFKYQQCFKKSKTRVHSFHFLTQLKQLEVLSIHHENKDLLLGSK